MTPSELVDLELSWGQQPLITLSNAVETQKEQQMGLEKLGFEIKVKNKYVNSIGMPWIGRNPSYL